MRGCMGKTRLFVVNIAEFVFTLPAATALRYFKREYETTVPDQAYLWPTKLNIFVGFAGFVNKSLLLQCSGQTRIHNAI